MQPLARPVSICAALMLAASMARADSMTPWSGASASVQVLGQPQSQSGTTATATAAGTQNVQYVNAGNPNFAKPFQVAVNGSADARATGQAADLLHLDASYSTPDPGTAPWLVSPSSVAVSAQAAWTGDRIQVTPAAGSIMPQSIRLNFAVNFLGTGQGGQMDYGTNGSAAIQITANGQSATIAGYTPSGSDGFYPNTNGSATSLTLDSFQMLNRSPSGTFYLSDVPYQATFHVDLPLNSAGLSDPFSLGLSAKPEGDLLSNHVIDSSFKDLSLSLTDVTLPDGTPLSTLGDSVSFASGMTFNTPEPSTMLLLSAGLAGLAIRKMRSGRGTCPGIGGR